MSLAGHVGTRRGPPVKLRIAVETTAVVIPKSREKESRGKCMPLFALLLGLLVAAPFGGMIFGSVDKEPATQQVQNQDIKIDAPEEQATVETEQ